MPETKVQNYANHAKFDPPFHFFLAPIFLINLIVCIVHAFRYPRLESFWTVVVALALLALVFKMRLYALKVQDRVIRLEERLRLTQLASEALRSRIGELTESQLIALRFASDAEAAGLATNALANGHKAKDIKQAIRNWRPDYFRV